MAKLKGQIEELKISLKLALKEPKPEVTSDLRTEKNWARGFFWCQRVNLG
jgi:hypothetical protein